MIRSTVYSLITMKTIILALAIVSLASAVPKPKLHYRNLYKKAIGEIEVKTNPRIIGGREAQPHQFPYQVFLEIYSRNEGWYCGGSLISQNYVLTAGHCGDEAQTAYVTLGAHKPLQSESSQIQLTSTNIKVHEDFNLDEILNDVSVIKLPQPVSFNSAIQPIALPTSTSKTYQGSIATVSGWGLTDGFADDISDVLEYVSVEIISNRECERVYGDLPDSNICTSGNENTGTCEGDSGGPLVVDGEQVGIVSFGVDHCLDGYPSAYARVTSFLNWIERNTDV